MIARIGTYIFYAALFFALGAWSGGHFRPIWNGLDRAGQTAANGARLLWQWARETSATPKPVLSSGTHSALEQPTSLADARDAFARGDIQAAIDNYARLLADHPGDIIARGELGNVYFNSGRTAEAARAYHAAALSMIAAGNVSDAQVLVPAIRIAAPALAADIEHRIAAAPPPSRG